ncbi:MAG: hypothetical protein EXR48_01185 [Dehalococcoidia bacterium]|nr:hypothetical protein [Dehalococcoidia bacterium]
MPDILVPLPLHAARERQRGYNQAALLAEELGQLLQVAVDRRTLVRSRATPPQARASDAAARHAAVAGAFSCRGAALAGKRVLLLDDVCTTAQHWTRARRRSWRAEQSACGRWW